MSTKLNADQQCALVSLIELAFIEKEEEFTVKESELLISVLYGDEEHKDLEKLLVFLENEELLKKWNITEEGIVEISMSQLPEIDVGASELRTLIRRRDKRLVLSYAFLQSLTQDDPFNEQQLQQLEVLTSLTSARISKACEALVEDYYLDSPRYMGFDGIVYRITQAGVSLCEDQRSLFDELSVVRGNVQQENEEHSESLGESDDGVREYVASSRIEQLRSVTSSKFDFSRTIKLCEELNVAYANGCYLTVGMQARGLIDHLPPVFEVSNFSQVANNYAGSKSFKKLMEKLNTDLRNMGDSYLHEQIRSKESIPNEVAVDFRNAIDALLSEVIRIS